MFEFEKERAKWQLERDNLISQRVEAQEQMERLQARKDQLVRENEKLKNDSKGSRKFLFGNTAGANQVPPTGQQSTSATRYMVNKSITSGAGGGIGGNILNHALGRMKENQQYSGKEEAKNVTPK